MPFQSRQFSPPRITKMPSCPSTDAFRSIESSNGTAEAAPYAPDLNNFSQALKAASQIEQHDGACRRHHDGSDQAVRMQAEQSEDEPANQRTDDAQNEIEQHTIAAASHDLAGEPSGQDSDRDLPQEVIHRASITELVSW